MANRKRFKRSDLFHIPLSELAQQENFNVRYALGSIEDLAASILENGLKQPLHAEKERGGTKHTITDGHRRFEALQHLVESGLIDSEYLVPVIKEKNVTDLEKDLNLILYNSGKELETLEKAEVYHRLHEKHELSMSGIAKKVGKSVAHVSQTLPLVHAPAEIKQLIITGDISGSLASRMLVKHESWEAVLAVIELALTLLEEDEDTLTPAIIRKAEKLIENQRIEDSAEEEPEGENVAEEEEETVEMPTRFLGSAYVNDSELDNDYNSEALVEAVKGNLEGKELELVLQALDLANTVTHTARSHKRNLEDAQNA